MHILSVVKLKYECDILCSCACVCALQRCIEAETCISAGQRAKRAHILCLVDIGIMGKSTA